MTTKKLLKQLKSILGYTQGEEGEHFKGIIKEISSKAEAIKGKREILTEDEKHPLAFKYIMGAMHWKQVLPYQRMPLPMRRAIPRQPKPM